MSKRWGSLLSGAVAGLESRLDSILAEEGTAAEKNAEFERRRAEAQAARKAAAAASDDAKKATPEKGSTARNETTLSSSADTLLQTQDSQASLEITDIKDNLTTATESRQSTDFAAEVEAADDPATADASTRLSQETTEAPSIALVTATADVPIKPSQVSEELQQQLSDLATEKADADSAHQEEVQGYLERIDALQEKLKYLADEAAKAAHQRLDGANTTSVEHQLAARDEKIAALMEEGQKLSKAEVMASTALRKLRQKAIDDQKAQAEARRVLAKAERASSSLSERVSKLELDKREAVAKLARLPRLEREIADLKRERSTKDATIDDLKRQLDEVKKAAQNGKREASDKALEQERQTAQSLRDDLANAKIEQELRDGRAQAQIKAAQEQLANEKKRQASTETALRNEIAVLESRLEVLRERSEEVSSASTTDSQVKLLRQVETLQSQYSVASENWQILEASLQSRLTALEKEKDDTAKAEAEARKRAREQANAARRLQEQCDDLNHRCQILEHEVSEHEMNERRQTQKTTELEKALADERQRFEKDKSSWQTSLKAKIEEERTKWESQSPKLQPSEHAFPSVGSPNLSNLRRTSGADLPGLSMRRSRGSELNISGFERPASSRRTSSRFGTDGLFGNGYASPLYAPPEAPPNAGDGDDQTEHASSPHRTINDMLSVQTTSAGPSVQLVERMSAAVRRLETEKAGTKEEITRLSSQRDEARKEIVNLMREVDQKRAIEAKLVKIESEFSDINARYGTTLEMLGEKSERVEELEADVADLKKIYRDLVDRSMKT